MQWIVTDLPHWRVTRLNIPQLAKGCAFCYVLCGLFARAIFNSKSKQRTAGNSNPDSSGNLSPHGSIPSLPLLPSEHHMCLVLSHTEASTSWFNTTKLRLPHHINATLDIVGPWGRRQTEGVKAGLQSTTVFRLIVSPGGDYSILRLVSLSLVMYPMVKRRTK